MKKPDPGMATSSNVKFDEVEEEDLSSEEEAEIEHELADVPLGELQKLRSDGSLAFHQKAKPEKKTGRANKNRPIEVSSRRPVGRYREVIQVLKAIRDPRFESLCGKLDESGFKKRYAFLYNENLPAEKKQLQELIKSTKDPKVSEELKDRVGWIDKQLKRDVSMDTEAQILAEHKKREKEAAKQGKRPFYLKKSEIRKQRLIDKYNHLKASGKLDSYIDKRRRRNAAKDHRFMPYRRQSNE